MSEREPDFQWVDVRLTLAEILLAAEVGVRRQVQNLKENRQHAHGADPETAPSWQMHIEGCLGELAVAKSYGVYWSGAIGDLEAADAGPLQVRATRYRSGHLTVHKPGGKDKPEAAFVLVVGHPPLLRLAGWAWGHEAQLDQYWSELQAGRPAYNMPQKALRKISTLRLSGGSLNIDNGSRKAGDG